jgi:NAD(P)-dependent dehydrogenase (short-subunit alcohol dehydrogenase family)
MIELGFESRVAIVTGAGGGLGREHALLLASRGARVVVNDLGGAVDGSGQSAGPAQRVVDEIEAAGGEAIADTHSVSDAAGAAAIVQTAIDAFGRIDIVVNNAGILRDRSFAKLTEDDMRSVIDVHLMGSYNVTSAAWPHFKEQSYGRIVSTSSAAGIFGNFGQANYGAAKMGLVGLSNVLAVEGAKSNIRSNVIAPIARTRMTEDVLGKLIDRVDAKLVSPLVAWLSHDECPVTGRVYSVGGGRVARLFIGMTTGWTRTDGELTMEDVRDHFSEIEDPTDATVPESINDDFRALARALR